MFRFYFIIIQFLLITMNVSAQQDSISRDFFKPNGECIRKDDRGKFYFAWGYNKNWYSRSDIHVFDESGANNFTLYDMKAHDRTHINELFKVALSIPQYGYRIGYWLPKSKFGIELKFDHAKYIMYDDQTARVKGSINGVYIDKDTLVDKNFLLLEHTDGANFLMLNIMYRHDFIAKRFITVAGVGKFGAGIVVPRSDVTLFGQRWNHCFHVAGQIAGFEAGVRTELFRYFFIEASVKGVYANFNKVLAINDFLISHRFWDGMVLLDAGFQFPIGKGGHKNVRAPN
jgi:hypothetical protein